MVVLSSVYLASGVSLALLVLATRIKNTGTQFAMSIAAFFGFMWAFGFLTIVPVLSLFGPAIFIGAIIYTFMAQGVYRWYSFLIVLILLGTVMLKI